MTDKKKSATAQSKAEAKKTTANRPDGRNKAAIAEATKDVANSQRQDRKKRASERRKAQEAVKSAGVGPDEKVKRGVAAVSAVLALTLDEDFVTAEDVKKITKLSDKANRVLLQRMCNFKLLRRSTALNSKSVPVFRYYAGKHPIFKS